jgi:hypothetical protein
VIVRVFSDGQYRIPEDAQATLTDLDAKALAALETDDEASFLAAYAALIDHIHAAGERLGDDELEPSDLILPPADISLEEAHGMFTGSFSAEGLLPD